MLNHTTHVGCKVSVRDAGQESLQRNGDMMKAGDLVENLHSESRMSGIVVGIEFRGRGFYKVRIPVVLWSDGRCSPIMPDMVVAINESR